MPEARGLGRPALLAIWCLAVTVTLVGGSWRIANSIFSNWKTDIQFPGSFVVLYLGWIIGPLQTIMSPPVVCVLTIATNGLCYYAVVRTVLFFRRAALHSE